MEQKALSGFVLKEKMRHLATRFSVSICHEFDYILSTQSTGILVTDCLLDSGIPREVVARKMLICASGPRGGDFQIASSIVRGLVDNIVFLQDTLVQEHEADIRLFNQIVKSSDREPVYMKTAARADLFFGTLEYQPETKVAA